MLLIVKLSILFVLLKCLLLLLLLFFIKQIIFNDSFKNTLVHNTNKLMLITTKINHNI